MSRVVVVWLAVTSMIGWQAPATGIEYRPELLVQIGVSDLDRAIRFYTGVLGFEVTERRDDLRFAHLDTNVPGLQIGLSAVPAPRGSGSIVINISVVDVAAARKALEAKGVKFTGETVIIPGKVSLAPFADPDGNVLRLAGPAPRREQGSGIRDQGSGIRDQVNIDGGLPVVMPCGSCQGRSPRQRRPSTTQLIPDP